MVPAWAQRHSWRPTVSLIDEADHDEANETEDRGGIEAKIALEALRDYGWRLGTATCTDPVLCMEETAAGSGGPCL